MRYPILALCLMSASAAAADCPPSPDIADAQDRLLAEVQVAPNEGSARQISDRLWDLWAKAPDEPSQELLNRGMQARREFNLITAIDAFDKLIAYCPDYAEGYNQRAFAYFLGQDFELALGDLNRAIALSPKHVAAISGKALTLIGLGRDDEAQDVLRIALAMNPWIPERRYIVEDPGQEL